MICGVLRNLADSRWTAIKISPHRHGDREGDTERYLAAGAAAALLLDAAPAEWPEGNVIVESGGVRDADVYLLVLDATRLEFKPSAAAMLERADAFVVTQGAWDGRGRPVFLAPPPGYESAALYDFLRRRLRETSGGR